MPSLLTSLVLCSSFALAKISDCHQEISQADKNECMSFEKVKALDKLMKKVTKFCADK